jgi:3-phenylpropionate/trans-cinnamate dioxygenase ferredoxin subunit
MSEDKLVWRQVAKVGDIEQEDLIGVEIDGQSYAIYWIDSGYFATYGKCSHECAPLADGFVDGDVIECPKHNARFHIPTGKAVRRPANTDLTVYPVKVEGDNIYIGLR